MKPRYSSVALMSLLMLSGCASTPPMTIALTEMGTATRTDKGTRALRLMRAVNATGLGAEDVVGSYSMDPDPYFFEIPPIIGSDSSPDSLASRIKPGCSWILETTFGSTMAQEDVLKVRDKLIELDMAAAKAAHAEQKRAILSVIQAQLLEMQDADKNSPTLKGQLLNLASGIAPSAKDPASLDIALKAATNDSDKEKLAFVAQKNKVNISLAKEGILVTNWVRTTKTSANAEITDAVNFGASKEKEVHGYLVMGGLRTATLVVGKDLLDAAKTGPLSGVKRQQLFVTQHSVSAKHLSWGESRSGLLVASLQVDVQKLLGIASGLETIPGLIQKLKEVPLRVSTSYATNYAAENTGALSGGTKKIHRFNFSDNAYEAAWTAELNRSSGYSTVIASRATLANLAGLLLEKQKEKDSAICETTGF